jgi:metal-responsive CopG/Arc/MetJ family transcriptional regulator
MPTAKVAITLDDALLKRVDRLVRKAVFPSRSRAIQDAVAEKLARMEHSQLARECAKLDPGEERAMAETGMDAEAREWPRY